MTRIYQKLYLDRLNLQQSQTRFSLEYIRSLRIYIMTSIKSSQGLQTSSDFLSPRTRYHKIDLNVNRFWRSTWSFCQWVILVRQFVYGYQIPWFYKKVNNLDHFVNPIYCTKRTLCYFASFDTVFLGVLFPSFNRMV